MAHEHGFVMPGHDPTLSSWVANTCPVDLLRYYCVHGHYVGYRNCFPCAICKDRPRFHPRLAQERTKKKARQRARHGRMAQR